MKLLMMLIFVFVFFYGWINNILELSKLDFESPYKAEIIRGAGIPIFFMGTVIGWMEIKDD